MRPPPEDELHAPEFPPRMDWLNVAFLRMDRLVGRNAALVEFWDFARINSLHTLPYLKAWHERYHGAGLRVIGVHCAGYSFGRDRATVAAAVERLQIEHAVLLDPELEVWRLYGNRGWPGRYLFDRRGVLRYVHYGEGDYLDCEQAIHEVLTELDRGFAAPSPLDPVRPEDAPGVLLEPQTADIALPADAERLQLVRDWLPGEDYLEAEDAGAAAEFTFSGGAAWAVLSGADREPGLYEVDGRVVAV
ncbi:MAG: redoxin domain-containing protein, partial [Actinomycetota bacterium]|nr:redoxin domain-containing protein [Actinomycetota bacterium]